MLTLLTLVLLARLAVAAFVPITFDEAYYAQWSRYLDWGYLDHPPGVALVGSLWTVFGNDAFFVRLGPFFASFLSLLILWRIGRMTAPNEKFNTGLATLLFHGSLAGLVGGILLTPDVGMILMWTLAMHETAAALYKDERRWISAGLVIGIGLMAKYMLVLFGAAALLTVVVSARSHLTKKWLYLGIVASVIGFAPHLFWNAANQWAPIQFQMGHGLAGSHDSGAKFASSLPRPIATPIGGAEEKFAAMLKTEAQIQFEKTRPPKRQLPAVLRPIARFAEFLGGQLALWGGLAPFIVLLLLKSRKKKPNFSKRQPVEHLFFWSAAVPLVFFGLISLFSKVEANWAASYLLGASLLIPRLGVAVGISPKWISYGVLFNVLALCLMTGDIYLKATAHKKNRLTSETHGYEQLAAHLNARSINPLFADRYQTISMLRFYEPTLKVDQWPGVTRVSELLRRKEMLSYAELHRSAPASFSLLTETDPPSHFSDYSLVGLEEVVDCSDGKIHRVEALENENYEPSCKASTFHRWLLAKYQRN